MHFLDPILGWLPLSEHVFIWDEPLAFVPPLRKLVIHNDTYITRRLELEGLKLTGHFYAPPGISVFCFCNPLSCQVLAESPVWLRCSQPSINLCAYASDEGRLAVSLGPKGDWFFGSASSPTEDEAVIRQGLSLLYAADEPNHHNLFRSCLRVRDYCAVI